MYEETYGDQTDGHHQDDFRADFDSWSVFFEESE